MRVYQFRHSGKSMSNCEFRMPNGKGCFSIRKSTLAIRSCSDPTRARTWDSRIKSPLLCQLSYGAIDIIAKAMYAARRDLFAAAPFTP